ncbi:hypothetical protein MP638_006753 [Amoeboaphelidium occidentale]|nr:hypothetical protein MP638_006753 [Amoeboaphelidium occidentale]
MNRTIFKKLFAFSDRNVFLVGTFYSAAVLYGVRREITGTEQLSPTLHRITVSLRGQPKKGDVVDPKRPSHFLIREPNSQGYRAFTPLLQYDDNDGQCGDEMDFIIRTYQRPFGEVAHYICKRKQGEHLLVHGPHYDADIYHLYDYFKQQQHNVKEKHDFGFVANGTGITAVYQVLQWLPSYLAKGSRISVLYSDRSVDDLVLKKDLDQLKQKFKHVSFDLVYFVPDQTFSKGSKEDNIVRGRIGIDVLKKYLPKPSKSQSSVPKVFVCGSPNLMRSLCGEREENGAQGILQGHLKALGYDSTEVFKF